MSEPLTMSAERRFPLQTSRDKSVKAGPLSIPWCIAEIAYAEYARRYGKSQSLERLAERGGFGWCEMDMLYPEWRERVDVVNRTQAELDAIRAERDLLAAVLTEARAAIDALAEHAEKTGVWLVAETKRKLFAEIDAALTKDTDNA